MPDPLEQLRALGDAVRAASPDPCPDVAAGIDRLVLSLEPDLAPAEVEADWIAYHRSLERPDAHGAPRTSRWWCGSCSAFVAGAATECRKCRHRGPHTFGEEAPTTGNADRRARLRADHKRRQRYRR